MRIRVDKVKDILRENIFVFVILLIVSFCTAFFIYIKFLQFPLFSKRNIFFALLLAVFLAIVLAAIYISFFKPIVKGLQRKTLTHLLAISFFLSIGIFSLFSIESNPLYFLYPRETVRISIDFTGESAGGDGLFITHLNTDFRDISFVELDISGKYEQQQEGLFFSSGQEAIVEWSGIPGKSLSLTFLPISPGHLVSVNWENDTQEDYQFSNLAVENKVKHDYAAPSNETLITRIFAFPVIFALILVLVLNLKGPLPYSSVPIAVWLLVLLVFWPGIIGDTNIIITDDLFAGLIEDWHPVVYTVILAGFIKLFSSVSSFLIFQILILGLTIGWGFTFLEKKGCPKWALWVISVVIALLPANMLSIITLTNDIPYGITLLMLTVLNIQIVFSKGEWLARAKNWIVFACVSLAAVLFRYNGIPAVAFTILALFLLIPKQWKNMLKISAFIITAYILISGPLFNALGVKRVSEGQLDNIILHHLSAHVDARTSLKEDQREYLNLLYPIGEWDYDCCTNGAMWFKDNFDRELFHSSSSLNRQILFDLIIKDPIVEVKHILCAGDMVWNIPGKCSVKHPFIEKTSSGYSWTRSYFPQYRDNSKMPSLVATLSEVFIGIENANFLNLIFWRPAVYLYLALVSVIIFQFRNKHLRSFLILAPLLGQTLFLFIFNRVQNFRYQFSAVLIGLFLLMFLFLPAKANHKE